MHYPIGKHTECTFDKTEQSCTWDAVSRAVRYNRYTGKPRYGVFAAQYTGITGTIDYFRKQWWKRTESNKGKLLCVK